MKTVINLKDFNHLPEISVYNNNYYKHKEANTNTTIFVDTDEFYNTDDVYICEGDSRIFLGSCHLRTDDILKFNVGVQYT